MLIVPTGSSPGWNKAMGWEQYAVPGTDPFPHMKPRASNGAPLPKESPVASENVTAKDLIAGLQQLVDRAHQHGIRVFVATLTPYEGADYFSQDGESVRQEVNQWIRMSNAFDGVIDFDTAVRDPEHPSRYREECQSGDHLHPVQPDTRRWLLRLTFRHSETISRSDAI